MSDVSVTLDLDADGPAVGHIRVPTSTNEAGWRNELVPVAVRGRIGDGPRALVIGGTHGDEFEGQFAVQRFLSELDDSEVAGQIIAIPTLSMPAARDATRLWPDGSNMNRVFPGDPSGSPSERLAYYLTNELFTRVDIVYDLHSGGRTAHMYPMAHMRRVDDPVQGRAMLGGMKAWNSDLHMLYTNVAGAGLLPDTAADMGKIVVTTELGGGGYIPPSTNDLGFSGLVNSLRHLDVLAGDAVTRDDLGLPPAPILSALDEANYLFAPVTGLVEITAAPGEQVAAGQCVARMRSIEDPWSPPLEIRSPKDGWICGVRAITKTLVGDNIVVIGEPVAEEDIW